MQAKSALFNSIQARPHHVEYKLTIAGVEIPASYIRSLRLEASLFEDYSIGHCNLRSANMEVQGNYHAGDEVVVYARLANATQQSEWIQWCTLLIFSRELVDGTYSVITAYDVLGKADYQFSRWAVWQDMTFAEAVDLICTDIGAELATGAAARIPAGTIYSDPMSMTARELLQHIAAAAGANWTTTYDGKLDLKPVTIPAATYMIVAADTVMNTYHQKQTYSRYVGVELEGQTLVYRSPSGLTEAQWEALKQTGRIMEGVCYWATQQMADDILEMLTGATQFSPWSADINVDICAELGEGIAIGDIESVFGYYTLDGSGGRLYGTLGAHGISNIERLAMYQPKVQRQLAATADFQRARIAVLENQIESEVTERTTQYGSLSQDIADSADRLQGEINDTNATVTELSSSLTQTATEINATITQKQTDLQGYAEQQAQTAADDLAATLATYIRYYQSGGTGVLELGDNASGYVAKLNNQKLSFYDGDTEVAYISNNKLYITNGEIQNNLQIGKYQWITDSTGRMSLKWVG